ncbi:MAG: sn-glycerol-3-phosphate ABC transporter ATP-binding protein UgpC [Sulfitobacter sp.]|uniref:ABC transporter ATP-binding protein n=1 Tax=Alphaproteobacteria TaxID=28211 RepID=UPI002943F4F8|nr:sn-glycerol-3-phosphate ABC transporter ATP-binding protein UgpC [Sulfitobacter sp. LC.270.F.C4]WOI16671.1 sn-glycerol-3-phosphate ABC transporter ATP-binding protein UgpC [Sulfitobacter sp. LC.270.F.C4]
MANVSVENLKKNYGSVEVIHGIDINIQDGEFVALVGPSGCGKSTLLRMIAGLEDVSGGTVRIDSNVINDIAPRDRDIAMVFQSYALYPHMTVAQNMGFALKLAKVPAAEMDARIREAAATLNLTDYLDRFPRELSGGQRQRVAMGRAIVRSPKVFLFDEPLSNLDAKLRVRMRTEIKSLHQRLGATSVYVTHDQIEAMTMADRIVVMRGGHIEQIGSPLELYDAPVNEFVATFIGSPSINLLEGTIDGSVFKLSDGSALPLPDWAYNSDGRAAKYGIRPEHFDLVQGAGMTVMKVDVVEPTGNETILTGTIGGQVVQITQQERLNLRPGQEIPVSLRLDAVHLFDALTGQRI